MKYFDPKGQHTKPIAIFKLKNNTIMKKETRKIKNLNTYTADGTWLDFGTQVDSIEEIEVGMTATIIANDANPAGGVPDGEYVMPDGGIWTFDQGTLKEMIEPEPEEGTETMRSKPRYKSISGKGKPVYLISKGRFMIKVRNPKSPGKPITGI